MSSLFQRLNDAGGTAVAPSVLAADFSRLAEELRSVEEAGADYLHIDVMDGVFVPNLTFGPMVVEAIAKLARVPLISHLMITNPEKLADRFVEAGSDVVSFHWEAMADGHEELLQRVAKLGCNVGLAINPDTPLTDVAHLLAHLDLLLIMTVFPGFGGQAFIEDVLPKVEEASRLKRDRGFRYVIEVDGGVTKGNADSVRRAGGQILVAGTAVFKSKDYAKAISSIRG